MKFLLLSLLAGCLAQETPEQEFLCTYVYRTGDPGTQAGEVIVSGADPEAQAIDTCLWAVDGVRWCKVVACDVQ